MDTNNMSIIFIVECSYPCEYSFGGDYVMTQRSDSNVIIIV